MKLSKNKKFGYFVNQARADLIKGVAATKRPDSDIFTLEYAGKLKKMWFYSPIIEVWRGVPGEWYGYYQASTFGQIKSLARRDRSHRNFQERIMKQSPAKKDYLTLRLCKDSKSKLFLTHRLIAMTFLENPFGYQMTNHKDGITNHNHIINLEMCGGSRNNLHAYDEGLRNDFGENNGLAKLTNIQACDIRKEIIFLTQKQLGRKYNVHQSGISRIVNNKIWRRVF